MHDIERLTLALVGGCGPSGWAKPAALRRFAADNPAQSRIVAQALGVVHILRISKLIRGFLTAGVLADGLVTT